ncbi:MAG: HNH endonuclease [Clostridia bacterium]|jgi:hypothetical protein|nr:HNH endonuclease [Clostridia bacterium]
MAREFAKDFYNSKKWEDCRKAFIAERIATDGGLCQVCHDKTGYIIHHRQKLTPENINDPMITLSFDNLEYVCHDCHNAIHFADWQHLDYKFVDGQPLPLSEK